MGVSKVIFGNTTLMDISTDTIASDGSDLAYGVTAHGADGELITGTSTKDSDTTDADATTSEILYGKTAYVNKNKLTGSMPNRGGVSAYISDKTVPYSIQSGYHDGSGTVGIDSTEAAKIIAENIKDGVSILGVTGSYAGEATPTQSKTATPGLTDQTILPDAGYALSQVTVYAISKVETTLPNGGKVVTIAGT